MTDNARERCSVLLNNQATLHCTVSRTTKIEKERRGKKEEGGGAKLSLAPLEGEGGREGRKEGSQTVSQSVDEITSRLSLSLSLSPLSPLSSLSLLCLSLSLAAFV